MEDLPGPVARPPRAGRRGSLAPSAAAAHPPWGLGASAPLPYPWGKSDPRSPDSREVHRMKQILVGLALAALALPAGAQPPADHQAALAAAQEEGKLLLLDFFTEW